jgi:predicted nucleic acid-binding protein
VVDESDSVALRDWAGSGPSLVASHLLYTESLRAAARIGLDQEAVHSAIGVVALILPGPATFFEAGRLQPGPLRSLDALHLATARELGPDLEGLVTYDQRMCEAARLASIPVHTPT